MTWEAHQSTDARPVLSMRVARVRWWGFRRGAVMESGQAQASTLASVHQTRGRIQVPLNFSQAVYQRERPTPKPFGYRPISQVLFVLEANPLPTKQNKKAFPAYRLSLENYNRNRCPAAMVKKPSKKSGAGPSAPKVGDARFANFQTDERFRLPSKKLGKTKIDSRFSRMLKDDQFTKAATVDRYGRKVQADAKKKALKNLYDASDDEDEEGNDDDKEDRAVERELKKANAKYDPARGGGFSSSESDSDSDDEDDGDEDEGAQVEAASSMQRLRDEEADVETGEVTRRLAVVNMDWDHVKSTDLMALFSSFVPEGCRIESVSVYPSEFGKERIQREELEGPPRDIFKNGTNSEDEGSDNDTEADESDEDEDDKIKQDLIEEGDADDFNSDALRKYQLDRLRYYYAVVVCDKEACAESIYKATDGTEYQTSSNFLDLRFIPDDVTFDDEPRDTCTAIPASYRPTEYITDALQHSKVKLTWE